MLWKQKEQLTCWGTPEGSEATVGSSYRQAGFPCVRGQRAVQKGSPGRRKICANVRSHKGMWQLGRARGYGFVDCFSRFLIFFFFCLFPNSLFW